MRVSTATMPRDATRLPVYSEIAMTLRRPHSEQRTVIVQVWLDVNGFQAVQLAVRTQHDEGYRLERLRHRPPSLLVSIVVRHQGSQICWHHVKLIARFVIGQ
jgi:hypothetical protein